MATDYDAPRRRAEDEIETDSLEGLKAAENVTNDMDDDGEIVEPFDLPTNLPARCASSCRIIAASTTPSPTAPSCARTAPNSRSPLTPSPPAPAVAQT